MLSKIRNILKITCNIIPIRRKPPQNIPAPIKAAEKAKQEWLHLQRMYHVAVEPELIDYTSYLIKAYEIKYTYLLRQVKKEGLCLSTNNMKLFQSYRH